MRRKPAPALRLPLVEENEDALPGRDYDSIVCCYSRLVWYCTNQRTGEVCHHSHRPAHAGICRHHNVLRGG